MSATLELLRAAQEGDRDACEQAVIENNGLIWTAPASPPTPCPKSPGRFVAFSGTTAR